MGHLFAYSLSVSLVMVPLYLTVRYAMRGLTFHRLHRALLLGVVVLSLLLPLAIPLLSSSAPAINIDAVEIVRATRAGGAAVADKAQQAVAAATGHRSGQMPIWLSGLLLVYIAGCAVALAYRLRSLLSLIRFVCSCEVAGEFRGLTVRVHDNPEINPFSWGGSIVLSVNDLEEEDLTVMMHEAAHLERKHWVDLLIVNLLTPLMWYNPAVWMIGRDLAIVHEYQADSAVISEGADPRTYQIMLVRRAAGSRFQLVVNSLGHAEITKRVRMMLRRKSKPAERLKAILTVPAVIISVVVLSVPGVSKTIGTIGRSSLNGFISNTAQKPASTGSREIPLMIAEQEAEEVIESEPESTEAPFAGPAPETYAEAATPSEPMAEVVKPESETEVTPAPAVSEEESPEPVEERSHEVAENVVKNKNHIFDAVETVPQFAGGIEALLNFISTHINYPPEAANNGISGRVMVKCVVDEQGNVPDVIILRSVHPLLDAEAVRVAKQVKFVTPAMQNGVPVSVYFTIPVNFRLTN